MGLQKQMNFPVKDSCRYNNQLCVGGFKPTIQDMFRTNSPHGLAMMSGYIYGIFLDDAQGVYLYMRNINAEGLPVLYFYYKAPGEGSIIPEGTNKLFLGMCVNRHRGDAIRVHSWRGIPGPGFSYTETPERFHLVEEGAMDLRGERVGLGVNILCPQKGQDIYWNNVFYEVEGTVFGRKVKGSLGSDRAYAPPGETWQSLRIFQEVEQTWVEGINIYDDGEKEMVHIATGTGDWGFLFASAGDKVTAVSRYVTAEIKMDQDHYPTRVRYKTDCGDWEWRPQPEDCRLNPQGLLMPLHWMQGKTQRIGEKRNTILSTALMEVIPTNLKG